MLAIAAAARSAGRPADGIAAAALPSSLGALRRRFLANVAHDHRDPRRGGQVTTVSTTETRTTLDEVTPEGVTLRVEVTMEVAGKHMATQPQIIRQGFSARPPART